MKRRLPTLLRLALFSALLLLSGCDAPGAPQNIWRDKSDIAIAISGLFREILVLGIIVGVLVEGALLVVVLRYRGKPTDGVPPQTHGNTRIEVIWTAAPAIVLATILVPTLQMIFQTQSPASANALEVRVIGHQFWWEFDYPSLGVTAANEIHFPLGTEASIVMHSADVIHSFWIPALGGHRDVNPSFTTYLKWTPNETGNFPGQCAELCGYSHANMRLRAFVQTPADFDAWVKQQKEPAAAPTDSAAIQGAQLFQQRGCAGCHTIDGTAAQAKVGPNLTHVAGRTTIAAGVLKNTPDDLKRWLRNPPAVKPGSLMPNLNLNDQDLDTLVAYLDTLK